MLSLLFIRPFVHSLHVKRICFYHKLKSFIAIFFLIVVTRIIADPENSSVLIEGVLFRCRYLGSTQLPVEGNPSKVSRMMQAQEAVERIKAPYGESQPSVEVDLFISTEKIMVLNTDLEDILMDHSLRSISYIG